jgi:hypothetical protein
MKKLLIPILYLLLLVACNNGKVSSAEGLDTGDNYIPIDAIDVCGNKVTYDLKIATESVERNPMIENNIYN